MSDPHFGHRDFYTGKPHEKSDGWTTWDYALINAYQTIQDWTDQHGNLVYEVSDPKERVIVSAVKKIDQFEAAKTSRTSGNNYKPSPGEYFIPKLDLKAGQDWPTLEEYIQHQIDEAQDGE